MFKQALSDERYLAVRNLVGLLGCVTDKILAAMAWSMGGRAAFVRHDFYYSVKEICGLLQTLFYKKSEGILDEGELAVLKRMFLVSEW